MEFRKMVAITLYARQQKRHRCMEQSFGLCGRRQGKVVSESGDLQYWEMDFISLTLVLLFAIAQTLQTCLIVPIHIKTRHPPPHLDHCPHA